MAVLSKTQILAADDVPRELIDVPEWDGQVWVRGISATERDILELQGVFGDAKGGADGVAVLPIICAMAICDEAGNRLFTRDEADELGKKNAGVLVRIVNVVLRLSGLREEDLKDLKKD